MCIHVCPCGTVPENISKYLPTVTDTGSFWIDHPPQMPLEIKNLTSLPVNKEEVTSDHVRNKQNSGCPELKCLC